MRNAQRRMVVNVSIDRDAFDHNRDRFITTHIQDRHTGQRLSQDTRHSSFSAMRAWHNGLYQGWYEFSPSGYVVLKGTAYIVDVNPMYSNAPDGD